MDLIRDLRYRQLVSMLPLRSSIFLPTDRVPYADAMLGLRRVLALYQHDLDQIYRPALRRLRSRYRGADRCFVIGNGPSLNKMDLELLRHESTFATNGFFLKADALSWQPSFYVVEDHLVAEDRRNEIVALEGSTKLFPANLAYCIPAAEDTVFFDHRPRRSFPDGFDFSMDAAGCTYTGCTVTFTCLQLAAYLGFREIYLIGVDADYDVPEDVHRTDRYGVEMLDMKTDDPNHFHPDYFGKGFRWHDPQVEKMIAAYREALRVTEREQIRIFNAGVGGKLDVFPRVDFESLFTSDPGRKASPSTAGKNVSPSRVLVIDLTLIGDGTATGELKKNLFEGWPSSQLFHVYGSSRGSIGVSGYIDGLPSKIADIDSDRVLDMIWGFEPDCVIYRPVPENPELHELAVRYIQRTSLPLITWIMDDWPENLRLKGDANYRPMEEDLIWLFRRSDYRLCISAAMQTAFETRYATSFIPLANGIDPDHWPESTEPSQRKTLIVRYAGALAANMVLDSVVRVAAAVDALAARGLDIRFEINTRKNWAATTYHRFRDFSSCQISTTQFSQENYREFLRDADILLIAYNFDETSQTYVRYSLANKLPECLMSGSALLLHGPRGIATIDYGADHLPEAVVDEPDQSAIEHWLAAFADSSELRAETARKGRLLGLRDFQITTRRQRLRELLSNAINASIPREIRSARRADAVQLDESELVAELLSQRTGPEHMMLDVGAHHGSSLRHFTSKGWQVYAFEPDAKNRSELIRRLGESANVTVDHRAVGDTAQPERPFYNSQVSTGISGLLPFHGSHEFSEDVEVTTIADIVAARSLQKVDFLKIDVEGMDFAVLRGVPWQSVKPDVIICEFEDRKTRDLGHIWKDIADYLSEQGYAVMVSEWYPIQEYGRVHEWRSLRDYPCELADNDGWGNLIAFSIRPDDEALRSALSATIKCQKRRNRVRNLLPVRLVGLAATTYRRIAFHVETQKNGRSIK